ncbi:MAG TPA: pyruvate ferredoxin oxidoreductase, partial [bacterium]|nr:pyruvate ferredoxin oxidoreductase [bacterium]
VETGIFPLYEVENGKYSLSINFPTLKPISDYMGQQGRFKHLKPETIALIQEKVVEKYNELKSKTGEVRA